MTGILPIKRYNTQSALNNFEEYTVLSPANLSSLFGFTEEETKALCERDGVDLQEMKYWYDGYRIGSECAMYNPYAVMKALKRNRFENYWVSTDTFESLQMYITMNFQGLKDDVLTLLCHLGYLSYDLDTRLARIPNFEIRQEFETAIATTGWSEVVDALQKSETALQSVLDGESEAVAKGDDRARVLLMTLVDNGIIHCCGENKERIYFL